MLSVGNNILCRPCKTRKGQASLINQESAPQGWERDKTPHYLAGVGHRPRGRRQTDPDANCKRNIFKLTIPSTQSDLYYLYNLSELSGVRHSTKAAQELCSWAILSVMLMIYYIHEPADETVMTPGWLMVRSHGWL